MRLSLIFVIVAVLAIVATAHKHHNEEGHEHKHKCENPVGAFFKRHAQCRACVVAPAPPAKHDRHSRHGDDSEHEGRERQHNDNDSDSVGDDVTVTSTSPFWKWCAAPGAASDSNGACVARTEECATGHKELTAGESCPSDVAASKPTCSLCTLDGYAWCQDADAIDDEYAGSCLESAIIDEDESNDDDEDSSDDSSDSDDEEDRDSRNGENSERLRVQDETVVVSSTGGVEPAPITTSSTGGVSPSPAASSTGSVIVGSSTGGIAPSPTPVPVPGKCPLNSKVITRFDECRSLAVAKAAWSARHHGWRHGRRHGAKIVGAIIPIVIALVIACCIRRRCIRRCAERRAARAAARAAVAAAASAGAPAGMPVAIATAMPMYNPGTTTVVGAAPLVYSHNPVAPMYSPSPAPAVPHLQTAEVEMREYPGVGSRTGTPSHSGAYARLDQEV